MIVLLEHRRGLVLVEDGENRHKLCPIIVHQNSLQVYCSLLPVMGYDVKYSSKSRAGNSLPFRGHDDGQELHFKKKKNTGKMGGSGTHL